MAPWSSTVAPRRRRDGENSLACDRFLRRERRPGDGGRRTHSRQDESDGEGVRAAHLSEDDAFLCAFSGGRRKSGGGERRMAARHRILEKATGGRLSEGRVR